MWRMLGEGVERYCAVNADEDRIILASYNELGESAVNPMLWVGYNDEIEEHDRYRFDPAQAMHWTEAYNLKTGKPAFVPAALVWLAFPTANRADRFHQTTSSGLAAGRTKDHAISSALSELIERDCFMARWMLRAVPPKLDPEAVGFQGADKRLLEMFRGGPLKAELFDLSIDAPDYTILGKVTLGGPEGFGIEPHRVCRRLFRLSYAAMAGSSSMA
ncbi:YcaO-like family protein [Rhizobium sp. L51/94]|uniref:YcaO-like family protein n=1 Tax=Rhizobium sp. L51/94 TaxID=2819999 RepID=UPI001C5A77A4|nr:YcaO-like family protein [Rhizobium sp. L51/94]QXZ82265.1 YcaO-like family protein [Rhizobium sp. L51/94]